MAAIRDRSVALVVTSPPYPMIEMWDDIFALQNEEIATRLEKSDAYGAFELMHRELDKVWAEVERILMPGGFACINIGDATRTINKEFALYPNHARIINAFNDLDMNNLPNIIWRKQTNAPNKFMGSGMLPAGAYVTLEHEWILIFRKGGKRKFTKEEEKEKRRSSSFFWEERNQWFSDLWDLKGTRQAIQNAESRKRSAAYPFEVPYRLINMYSLKNDMIVDPFLGTGTTTFAAIASERNSVGYEIDPTFRESVLNLLRNFEPDFYNQRTLERLSLHKKFTTERLATKGADSVKYFNALINEPVMTRQELQLSFNYVKNVREQEKSFVAEYSIST